MNFQIVIDALTKILTDIVNFIPDLVNGLIILIVGYTLSRIIRWIVYNLLLRLRVDPLTERVGITGTLRGFGVKTPLSTILAQTIFSFLLLSFLITSMRLMKLEAVARLLEQLLTYLPNMIAAVILFLFGGIVAQFIGGVIASAALAAGLSYGARLGRLVQVVLSVFVAVLALSQLGIDTAILVTAITLMIAAFGLALALAIGLGMRSVVGHLMAGFYMRQRLTAGRVVEVGNSHGTLESVGGVNTLLRATDADLVVPNTVLLESIIRSPRSDSQPGDQSA